jgi:hypothetical protein
MPRKKKAKPMTITRKRRIIGTLLFILAVIQICNFAVRDVHARPSLYYSRAHFEQKGITGVLIGNANLPFKVFNYAMIRLLGWAGLLTPLFFFIIGFTFFRRRTDKLKRTRLLWIWGFGEITLFVYIINFISFIVVPPGTIWPGIIAELFSRYLQKVGGVFFLVVFFCYSLTAFFIFARKSNWKAFWKGSLRLAGSSVALIASGIGYLFDAKKRANRTTSGKQLKAPKAANKKNGINKNGTGAGTITSSSSESSTGNPENGTVTETVTTGSDIVETTYENQPITTFDSTSIDFTFDHSVLKVNSNTPVSDEELREITGKIQEVFRSFNIHLERKGYTVGPQIIRFEYSIPDGLQVKEVERYTRDLSSRIGGLAVTMEVPIPGTNMFGIYIPRSKPDMLGLGSYIQKSDERSESVPLFVGIAPDGSDVWTDAASMPHLLVAGSTGSGKSVFLNAVIVSLLALSGKTPVNLVLVDPKRVEFSPFNTLPQLAGPIITDTDSAIEIIKAAEHLMESRYEQLSSAGVRNISEYNEHESGVMPYLFIIIDEFSDLVMQDTSNTIKTSIIRLAQKSRAVGIHLILATQRPSADVIDGLIKANFPSRIAFKTASQVDSRIILDEQGAESLLGSGDMLFRSPSGSMQRLQGIYISLDEIRKINN